MKRNLIKKLATLGLIGAMFIPNLVFASDTVTSATTGAPADRPAANRPVKEGLKDRAEDLKDRMEKNQDRRDQFDDRTLELVTLYAPDLLESYQTVTDTHESIHDSLEALHKSDFESRADEFKTFLNSIKDQLTAGTITREEAKTQIDAFRKENDTERDALRTKLDTLKTTYGLDQEAHRTLMTTLKTAVDNNDEAAIKSALTSLLSELQKHVQYDQAVYNLLASK